MSGAFDPSSVTWVIDTSAVTQIRRETLASRRQPILDALGQLCEDGRLVYPAQVVKELERREGKAEDQLCTFVKKWQSVACSRGEPFEELRTVMGHPQASRMVDPNKTSGPEEADPYVVALALSIRSESMQVGVISEDMRDRPNKLSIATACGLFGIVRLPMIPFLLESGLCTKSDLGDGHVY